MIMLFLGHLLLHGWLLGYVPSTGVDLVVLGTVQDAGSPHIGCQKDCCKDLFANPDPTRKVTSLGLLDHAADKKFIFEASPDLSAQLELLQNSYPETGHLLPNGIFLTHAHIGHYTGLMYLGREAINAQGVEVFCMPRMQAYLQSNGPWSQLLQLGNIHPKTLSPDTPLPLTKNILVQPFRVPHRDEYSETVGYLIEGPSKKALFIPDIDKWEKWGRDIREEIKNVDYALIDATFFDAAEINYRDIAEIPHPFVVETMNTFAEWPTSEKAKIIFIHLNHTNPLLDPTSEATRFVLEQGFQVARLGQVIRL